MNDWDRSLTEDFSEPEPEPLIGELDKAFGPKKTGQEYRPAPTNWPDAPERLRLILDKLDELQGGTPLSAKFRRNRIAAAGEWVSEYGEQSVQLFERAYNKAKEAKLTVATERSLINIAMPMKWDRQDKPACEHCGGPGGAWHNIDCPLWGGS